MVVAHKRAVRRSEPCGASGGENGDGHPLKEHWEDGQVLLPSGLDDVNNAEWNVPDKQREDNHANPDVSGGSFANHFGEARKRVSPEEMDRLCPHLRAVDTRENHNGASNEQAFRRTVKVSEIQSVGVVSLPGREEHGQARNQGCENTGRARSQSNSGGFEETGECAVEGVDTVVEKFTEAARGSGSASLLAVDVIHGLIHEQAECEAKVHP